ncbi:MAG: hypothetical protein ACM3MG_09560 [Bacillota bacterium]
MAGLAIFFILVGSLILMIGYTIYNPHSIFTAFDKVTTHFTRGEPYSENGEFFLQGIKALHIKSSRMKLEIVPYSGNTLKISLDGKVPRFEHGPFILERATESEVTIELHEPIASQWIHMNINGQEVTEESNSVLVGKIYLPRSFKGSATIETDSGPVEMTLPKDQFYEFDLQSTSGKIENQAVIDSTLPVPAEVAKIHILTTTGNITLLPQGGSAK